MVKEEQGKLAEAEALGRICVNNHAKYIGPRTCSQLAITWY
jgi:hypothetical protein